MSLISELLFFPLQLAVNFWISLVLVRTWAFATQAPMRQPLGEFIMRLTDFAVLPVRRTINPAGRWDCGSVALTYLVTLAFVVLAGLVFGALLARGGYVWAAVVVLTRWAVYVLIAVLIVQAVLSWTQTNAAAAAFTQALTEPLLAPIRRIVPLAGNVDLSPLVLIVLANMLLIVIDHVSKQAVF